MTPLRHTVLVCLSLFVSFVAFGQAPPAPSVFWDQASYTVNEGGSVVLRVRRTGDLSGGQTVSLSHQMSFFQPQRTYSLDQQQVFFNPGETQKDVVLSVVNGDQVYQANSQINVSLSSNAATVISPSTTTVVVRDDEPASLIDFAFNSFAGIESSGAVDVVVRRSGVTNVQTSVTLSASAASASSGTDYTFTTMTLTFAPGETLKTIPVPVINDNLPESDEFFNVTLSQPVNGGLTGTTHASASIIDDDAQAVVSFTAPTVIVAEPDGAASVSVERSGDLTGTVTVQYSTSCCGGATPGFDYQHTSGSLTFAPGETLKSFSIPIINDTVPEVIESVPVNLSSFGNARVGRSSMTVVITDEDTEAVAPPTIGFAENSYGAAENANSVAITIRREGDPTTSISAAYRTAPTDFFSSNPNATANVDYTPVAGTLTFAPGETLKTIHVPLIDDTIHEGPEVFAFWLNTGMFNNSRTVLITDNETPVYVGFDSSIYSAGEGDGGATVRIARIGDPQATVTVTMQTSSGCCSAGTADYEPVATTLTFAPGEMLKQVVIPILEDTAVEGSETFGVNLIGPVGGSINLATATVAILDNDTPPDTATYTISTTNAYEGDKAVQFTITRIGQLNQTTTVAASATADGFGSAIAGSDFVPVTTLLTFAPGQTTAIFGVELIDDDVPEFDEAFRVTVGTVNRTVIIRDDDTGPVVSFGDLTVQEGTGGNKVVRLPVTLSSPSPVEISATIQHIGGTATNNSDYFYEGFVSFRPGETQKTLSITIVGDSVDERDEYAVFVLNNPFCSQNRCTLGPKSTGNLTILNDDFTFHVDDLSVNEGSTAELTVRLSGPLATTATVNYMTIPGSATADDFNGAGGTLTFAPGETSKKIALTIHDDPIGEPEEKLYLRISDAVGAPITRSQAVVTIVDNDPRFNVTKDIEYAVAGGMPLVLDLYVPNNAPGTVPLIIWIPGNDWLTAPRWPTPARRQLDRGYAVAVVQYRTTDIALFPAQLHDLKAAVRWLRANAQRYGLDPNRFAAWGAGAGGHLAALLGTTDGVSKLDDPSLGNPAISSRVQGVIDWAGPTDLAQLQADALACSTINHNSAGAPVAMLIGCPLIVCETEAVIASPTSYVSPDDPPFLIVHGDADCEISPRQSETLARLLKARRVDTTLKLMRGLGHIDASWESPDATADVDWFLDTKIRGTHVRSRSVR